MRPFTLLIKPASADCNMNCRYCFYLEKSSLYPEEKTHRMSGETLEKLISSYMKTSQPCYTFGWQGGEPTLMGTDFFKEAVKLQEKFGRKGSLVTNGLQTNTTLIDKDMAERLLRYDMHLAVDAFFTLPTEIRINLNENRRRVLMNMIFNLGLPKLLGFKKMLKAIENDDYDGAADEMLDSRWAKQVKGRAVELADIMRKGN